MTLFPFAALRDSLMSSPHQGPITLKPGDKNANEAHRQFLGELLEDAGTLTEKSAPQAEEKPQYLSRQWVDDNGGQNDNSKKIPGSVIAESVGDMFCREISRIRSRIERRASAWVNMFFRKPVIRV